ncbi:hypothetical protein [Cellulomonas edaphi]|uniref:Uncharacterized protein n=1 Tax=Cellulomonas edaphi TaxID=3053468 RepID=A0ABT7S6H0_9CELL|nr:hypothetical protein [Cellulomons edaphi]MDM7830647.1 hypothetical protein [Cellulomons edaphi]
MSEVDVWAPLGRAGRIPVRDELSVTDLLTMPRATPYAHRCDLDVAGHRVDLSWHHRELVASLASADGPREIVRATAESGSGPGGIVWEFTVMPALVLGLRVDVQRQRSGLDRWSLAVHGPGGRTWQWRPEGRILADRLDLTRAGEKAAVVTHELRPVPGRSRSDTGPPHVAWQESASLAEVLLPVMWVLDRAYSGLLPKQQRIVQFDFL